MKFKKTIAAALFSIMSIGATNASAATPFISCLENPLVQFDGTVVDAAIATPELSTLVTAVTAAGLGDLLATAENITVYAPTNDAFAKIPGMVLNEFLADVDALTGILAYHVTPVPADPRKFITPLRRMTLAEQPVFFHRMNNNQMVNNAIVDCTGVRTNNGTVWLIDSVLMPSS